MKQALAYCGLICAGCPIRLATREPDPAAQARLRADIARRCREHYGLNYAPEDIGDCDGCRSEGGRLFAPSRNCEIRNCARQKGFDTCAECGEYACARLAPIFADEPAARTRLDELRRGP